jgi:hypothetical protein
VFLLSTDTLYVWGEADTVEREAIKNTEENGIVFSDEIDKIIDVHRCDDPPVGIHNLTLLVSPSCKGLGRGVSEQASKACRQIATRRSRSRDGE